MKPVAEPTKLRRLSRTEYNALTPKGKKQYDAQFKKSRHSRAERTGKKRFQKTGKLDGRETRKQATQRTKEEAAQVDKQRNTMYEEGAGVINKESVKALALVQPQHLQQAATNIEANRTEIISMVNQQLADKPNMAKRGLTALREMTQGGLMDDSDAIEGEFTEIDEDAQAVDHDGEPVHDDNGDPVSYREAKEKGMNIDAKDMPYVGRDGKAAMFSDGTPITRGDVDNFKLGKPKLSAKDAKKPYLDEKGDPVFYEDGTQMTMQDKADDDYDEIREALSVKRGKDRAHKDAKKQRDGKAVALTIVKHSLLAAGVAAIALAAGPMAMVIGRGLLDLYSDMRSLSSTPSDEDDEMISEMITQTSNYLRNMDMSDLHDQSKDMFKAIASHKVDVYNTTFSAVLPFTTERPRGRVGKNFFGGASVPMDVLGEAIANALGSQGVLTEHEVSRSPDDQCHMFYCKDRHLVALGMNEELGIYHVAFLNW